MFVDEIKVTIQQIGMAIFNADEAEARARYQEEHSAAGSGWATVAGTSFSVVERRDDYCATAFAYGSQPQAAPRYNLATADADLGEFEREGPRSARTPARMSQSLLDKRARLSGKSPFI